MKLGIAEARLRLAYINQYRELALGLLFVLALSARILGLPVADAIILTLGIWFGLAWIFVQASTAASVEARLHQIEFGYFVLELGLITLLARFAGVAAWLALLFYVVTILYAHMVLPRRYALWITVLAAGTFTLLIVLEMGRGQAPNSLFAGFHGGYALATLILGAIGGYALIGLTMAQFSLMLNSQAEALVTANRDLNATTQELRLHRDHLEEMVRQRTSDLQRATDELRRANADLRRLNELKSSFLANVSHELRTPLTSIRSFSELLLRYPDEEAATRAEFLQIIMDESDRLTRLINDVLDLAKIEAGKIEWRPQPVHLGELARQALELIQVVAARKGLSLVNRVPSDLPLVRADPDRLLQVFTNLLSNALKFTAAGSIELGARRRGDEIVISVRDTGIGIPATDLERIFEKFHQQGNTLTSKPAGTGLGLSICREIIQHHGGRIWAESQEGRGTTFYCTLPAPAARSVAASDIIGRAG